MAVADNRAPTLIRDYSRAFIEADGNKDGKLDRDEFVTAEAIHDRIVTGNYVEDSVITAKVRAAVAVNGVASVKDAMVVR